MKCKKFSDQIILYLYGELTDVDKAAIEKHIDTCSACREEMVYTKSIFEAVDETKPVDIPEGDWDKNWTEVKRVISKPQQSGQSRPVFPRWAYGAAAILLIFILGIFAGRMWFSSPDSPDLSGMREGSMQTAFNHHIDNIKPLMIDYANYVKTEENGGSVIVDREFLRGLLVQNILLKRILAEKDPEAAELLDDIDIVLRELENLDKNDTRTPALIKELIQKREILFKMEILQKT
jgi:hypothetical protein